MDKAVLQQYAERIPLEVRSILKGLDDEDRLGIIIALLENGKMTFSEMKEKFDLHSSSLTNHLNILQEGNLVQNFYEKNDSRVHSFYDATDIPESVFHALLDISFKDTSKKYSNSDDIFVKSPESVTQSIEYTEKINRPNDFIRQKISAT